MGERQACQCPSLAVAGEAPGQDQRDEIRTDTVTHNSVLLYTDIGLQLSRLERG